MKCYVLHETVNFYKLFVIDNNFIVIIPSVTLHLAWFPELCVVLKLILN